MILGWARLPVERGDMRNATDAQMPVSRAFQRLVAGTAAAAIIASLRR